jgi:hypothetical protein
MGKVVPGQSTGFKIVGEEGDIWAGTLIPRAFLFLLFSYNA